MTTPSSRPSAASGETSPSVQVPRLRSGRGIPLISTERSERRDPTLGPGPSTTLGTRNPPLISTERSERRDLPLGPGPSTTLGTRNPPSSRPSAASGETPPSVQVPRLRSGRGIPPSSRPSAASGETSPSVQVPRLRSGRGIPPRLDRAQRAERPPPRSRSLDYARDEESPLISTERSERRDPTHRTKVPRLRSGQAKN